VATFRSIIALALVCFWINSTALACLPNAQMSAAEMACCKKMAGDCHMGTGQHPCCKTVSNAPQSVASVPAAVHVTPDFTLVALIGAPESTLSSEGERAQASLGLPPPAPPGPSSILRI
jgi:hypothetical protein